MKTLLLLTVLFAGAYTTDYAPFEKANPIKILTYGGSSAKDIRSIGRSLAADLTQNEDFTTYATKVYDIANNDKLGTAEMVTELKEVALPLVVLLGLEIILAIFLFIGFCCTPFCCCCCNKTQKQTSAMSMWRMIWGAILIVLLGANIAGLAILFVAGSEMLSLSDATEATFDSMSEGVTGYLDETNAQLTMLIAPADGQLKTFMDKLNPLFNDALEGAVSNIQADITLKGHVDKIIESLNDLDTNIESAGTDLTTLTTSINTLKESLTNINAGLNTCKTKVEECDTNNGNACATAGIDAADFTVTFDPDSIVTTDLVTAQDSVTTMSTINGKTLSQWATEVNRLWNDMLTTVKEQTGDTATEYTKTLDDAEAEFRTLIQDTAIDKITKAKTDVKKSFADAKESFSDALKSGKDAMLMKSDDNDDIEPIMKYGAFGVFVLVSLLLGLILLTVVIGLLATVLGCCKADDSVIPTERRTGCCGTLLMCTSYCSVFLCAVATLTAGLLLVPMVTEEGLCKQYNSDTLLTGLDGLLQTARPNEKSLDKMIQDALTLTRPVSVQGLMDSCKEEKTFFAALDLSKSDTIGGTFSIQGTIDDVNAQIDGFDSSAIDSMNFDLELMSDSDKEVLVNNKAALKPAGYADIKSTVEGTDTKAGALDPAVVKTKISALDVAIQAALQDCTNALDTIANEIAQVDPTEKTAVVNAIDAVSGTADTAMTNIDKFLEGLQGITDDAPATIKTKVQEQVAKTKDSAKAVIVEFLDFVFVELQTTILSCQPLAAAYYSIMNYSCDGIFIHITLIYLALALIGSSLLWYACVSRCLARYFIKFGRLHPDDEGVAMGDGWAKEHSMTPLGAGNKVGPHPGYYAQTKL